MRPEAWNILTNAALSARSSGGTSIGLVELLAVTAPDFVPLQAEVPTAEGLLAPVPKCDILLSAAAVNSLKEAGGLEELSFERLRNEILSKGRLDRADR